MQAQQFDSGRQEAHQFIKYNDSHNGNFEVYLSVSTHSPASATITFLIMNETFSTGITCVSDAALSNR